MDGIPLSVICDYVLFLDVDSACGQFLGQVGDTPEDYRVYDGGVLHVLGLYPRGSPVPKLMTGTPFSMK